MLQWKEPGWIFLRCAAQSRAAPVHGEKLSLLVVWAIIGFPCKEITLFLKDAPMRTCRCAGRHRQGQAGGTVAGAEREPVRARGAVSIESLMGCCTRGVGLPSAAWARSRSPWSASLTPKCAKVSRSGGGLYYCSPRVSNLSMWISKLRPSLVGDSI